MRTLCGLLLSIAWTAHAQPAANPDWDALKSLVGDWVGEGSGQPGKGSGGFSFAPDLQGRVLVRRNRAEYPATKERPFFVHDDLMIISVQPGGQKVRAIYFDSEGHEIRYGVTAIPARRQVVFLSDTNQAEPRYRLTYTTVDANQMNLKFEIAPPAKPEDFSVYISALVTRK